MTEPKKFKNESQDARRHDQQKATHPEDKDAKKQAKDIHSQPNKRK